ncbi:MAG: hypothetical protein V1816_28595 [Pseudomonadota bacterium]
MVKFDRSIAPGREGKISLSIHVYPSWAGERFTKRALVITNDPNTPNFPLVLSGKVEGLPQGTLGPQGGAGGAPTLGPRPATPADPDDQG